MPAGSPAEHRQQDEEFLSFALELVARAGSLALSMQERCRGTLKPDRTVVTEADLQVQTLIREEISRRYPDHAFMGEEDEGLDPLASGMVPGGLWIVDPVDGTDSFLRHLPTWAISLGLAVRGVPRVGVVSIPSSGDVFWAIAGGPAYRNGREIRVTDEVGLTRDSILLTPSQLHLHVDVAFPGKLRSYGSTCAHLCFVAAGSVQAAVFGGARPWDVFAAGIVLEAAGGGLYQVDGARLDLGVLARERATAPVVVAGPQALALPIYQTLRLRWQG
jgi:fructose-1,6-bisphosphatase/inositol monophosphatase family enzyme